MLARAIDEAKRLHETGRTWPGAICIAARRFNVDRGELARALAMRAVSKRRTTQARCSSPLRSDSQRFAPYRNATELLETEE